MYSTSVSDHFKLKQRLENLFIVLIWFYQAVIVRYTDLEDIKITKSNSDC